MTVNSTSSSYLGRPDAAQQVLVAQVWTQDVVDRDADVRDVGLSILVRAFETPVVNNLSGRSSFTLAMSGVTSGQPILVMDYGWDTTGASGISDDFDTPYTWTKVVGKNTSGGTNTEIWIGTGGAGPSGTVTVTRAVSQTWGGIGVACAGASTAAGAEAIDSSSSSNSASSATVTPAALTPSAADQGAWYVSRGAVYNPTDYPDAPWVSTDLSAGATKTAGMATHASPAAAELEHR